MGRVERVERVEKRELGNVAAMRELVRCIVKSLGGKAEVAPTTMTPHEVAILNQCRAALAVPARNCDMPLVEDGPADNNADKAWIVFKQHNPDAYFDVPGLLRCIDWLLAPATEGGAA